MDVGDLSHLEFLHSKELRYHAAYNQSPYFDSLAETSDVKAHIKMIRRSSSDFSSMPVENSSFCLKNFLNQSEH